MPAKSTYIKRPKLAIRFSIGDRITLTSDWRGLDCRDVPAGSTGKIIEIVGQLAIIEYDRYGVGSADMQLLVKAKAES